MAFPNKPPAAVGDPRGGGVSPRWVRRPDKMKAHIAEIGDSMTLCGERVRLVNIEFAAYPFKCADCTRLWGAR